MKAEEIRKHFIEYFVKHSHEHVSSSRLIPQDDPTLLFTNSGMVQFKNVFLGYDKRQYKRATTAQKCLRAGGKHNDLDNVGHTARHHTFFEMMGNFSFGDYFKKEAIHFAWDLLTNILKIPKDKLYVTVFREDDEAFEIWHKQEKVPKEKISRFDEKDNFWQMADTGPCGPCSEIFYDHGPQPNCPNPAKCKVGCSCDRFVEIWNLVFMQFNKDESGKLHPLPKPSVDTGLGLERVAAVMQGVTSNYDTDLFKDLFKIMEKISGKTYEPLNPANEEINTAMRVMADHSRATAFLIADGIIPSNEGQGYVLRRIMRRGLRYGKKLSQKNLMGPTVEGVISKMGGHYKELQERKDFILTTVQMEKDRFFTTLDQGTEILNDEIRKLKSSHGKILSGETVFKLYDTFGFPLDLTVVMAKEAGLEINEADFHKKMETQKLTAKAGGKFDSSGTAEMGALMKATQNFPKTEFIGYSTLGAQTKILGLFENGNKVSALSKTGVLAVEKTPFYAEGGGQVGDHGSGHSKAGAKFKITDTKKINDVYLHFIEVHTGTLKDDDEIDFSVSTERLNTQRNHSATHLLHAALRGVLGSHVTQAGSLVEPKRLRFDFTHTQPMTQDQINLVEKIVNEEISLCSPVEIKHTNYNDAIKSGAIALFGEKYGDKVRVLKMGNFSTELCGGTHVLNTSDIRVFKILSEAGVSSGVRRIEAVTGDVALEYLVNRDRTLTEVEHSLKVTDGRVVEKIQKLSDHIKKLERDIKSALSKSSNIDIEHLVASAQNVKDTHLVSAHVEISDRELLSQLSDKIKDKIKSGIVVLIGSSSEENPTCPIVVGVTRDLIEKYHAGQILKQVAGVMEGKGGGRPDFAQGSGPRADKAEEAAKNAIKFI